MISYKISNEAIIDLKNIWLYTFENWSIEQADRYINQIIDEIEYLAKNPKSGKNYGHIKENYFRSKVKSHFIFYKISTLDNELEIIRILHQRMDINSRLND